VAQFLLTTTLLTIAGLLGTSVIGFTANSGSATAQHIMAALATVVLGLFSQSMTMFFFIGTGKEIKEKTSERDVIAQTREFKSRVFPAAMYAMIALMATFILGGGVHTGKLPIWTHQLLVALSIFMFLRAYVIEHRAMEANARLMEQYLAE
jgi:4-hydroxybenzoate polyprenyltransferase